MCTAGRIAIQSEREQNQDFEAEPPTIKPASYAVSSRIATKLIQAGCLKMVAELEEELLHL